MMGLNSSRNIVDAMMANADDPGRVEREWKRKVATFARPEPQPLSGTDSAGILPYLSERLSDLVGNIQLLIDADNVRNVDIVRMTCVPHDPNWGGMLVSAQVAVSKTMDDNGEAVKLLLDKMVADLRKKVLNEAPFTNTKPWTSENIDRTYGKADTFPGSYDLMGDEWEAEPEPKPEPKKLLPTNDQGRTFRRP